MSQLCPLCLLIGFADEKGLEEDHFRRDFVVFHPVEKRTALRQVRNQIW